MVSGQITAGAHITSGMVLPAPQHRCVWFLYPHRIIIYVIGRFNNDNYYPGNLTNRQVDQLWKFHE